MSANDLQRLALQHPDARRSTVRQALPADDFQAQKHKHLSRKASGGAIGIIRNAGGKIVLVRRSGMHPGWALPGGTVEEGEEFVAAFSREIAEEIGISIDMPELIEIEQKTFVSPEDETLDFMLAIFSARMAEDELPAQTDDALSEGLTVALFDPATIPAEMILGDRQKLTAFLGVAEI